MWCRNSDILAPPLGVTKKKAVGFCGEDKIVLFLYIQDEVFAYYSMLGVSYNATIGTAVIISLSGSSFLTVQQ